MAEAKTKTKDEKGAGDGEHEADPPQGPPGDGGGDPGPGDSGAGDILGAVKGAAREVFEELFGDGSDDAPAGGDGDDDVSTKTKTPPASQSAAAVSASAEDQVRAALAKVEHEKRTESRLDALEETASKIVEETPRKLSRLTRAFWGDAPRGGEK